VGGVWAMVGEKEKEMKKGEEGFSDQSGGTSW